MSKHVRVAVGVTVLLASAVSIAAAGDSPATMMTFDDVNGSRFYALSVKPTESVQGAPSRDVLILVDTSASQVGAYREDSIAAVESMLQGMSKNDRVGLAAIDLKAVALSKGFVAPQSADAKAGLVKLHQRAPLGSTDMIDGLATATRWFKRDASVPRHIIYIGDGVSHADNPTSQQFAKLVTRLADQQVTVSSYAIGPQRDMHLLAALANQTGGRVFVDASDISGQQAGQQLIKTVASPVIWPSSGEMGQSIAETFPKRFPPLRTDRDSIVIGTLKGNPGTVAIKGKVNGQPVQLSWKVAVKPSSDDYSFLPQLVESARRDGGASLATLGTGALRQIRRTMVSGADQLTAARWSSVGQRQCRRGSTVGPGSSETRPVQFAGRDTAERRRQEGSRDNAVGR